MYWWTYFSVDDSGEFDGEFDEFNEFAGGVDGSGGDDRVMIDLVIVVMVAMKDLVILVIGDDFSG